MSTYTPIASQTLTGSVSSITFSNIPQNFTDLVIVSSFLCSTADYGITYQFNSDTGANYSSTYLGGSGSSASSGRTTNYNFNNASLLIGGSTTERMLTIINIMNYSNSTTYNLNGVRKKLMRRVRHSVAFFGSKAIARCSNNTPAA